MGNNPSQNAPFGQNTDNIDIKGRSNGKGNSDVKDMLHNAGILFLITLLAGLILGFVHELTRQYRRHAGRYLKAQTVLRLLKIRSAKHLLTA